MVDLNAPSPPRISDPVSDLLTTTASPIMTTTPPIMVTTPSTSPRPASRHPTSPQPDVSVPSATSASSESTIASSALATQAPPQRTASSASTILMRTVDQFRSEYSRTGHVGAEPDSSYRFPVSSHGPMTVAYNRVKDFAAAMAQDLQQLDRNHAVSFFNFSLRRPQIGRLFFRWVRASAPTGCSPRDSGRLLAIGSDLYVF